MDVNGELIRRVWEKASVIPGQDSDVYRIDMSGVWIRLKDYNDEESVYGWTIYAVDGVDLALTNLARLVPLHTFNNHTINGTLSGSGAEMLQEPLL